LFITAFYCLRQKFINLLSLLITASQCSTLSEKVLMWTVHQSIAQWFHIVCKSWQYNVLHNSLTFCVCLDTTIFFQKDSHRMYVLTVQYYPQSYKIMSESWQYNFMQNGSTLYVCRDSIIKCTTNLHCVWVGTIQHSTQRFRIVCESRDSKIFCPTASTHQ
jgi:hypothetical protein